MKTTATTKIIAYVEDDLDIREITTDWLKEDKNIKIRSFDNYRDYINALSLGLEPDLLLADVHVPLMNFMDYTKTVNTFAPTIVLTGDVEMTSCKDRHIGTYGIVEVESKFGYIFTNKDPGVLFEIANREVTSKFQLKLVAG